MTLIDMNKPFKLMTILNGKRAYVPEPGKSIRFYDKKYTIVDIKRTEEGFELYVIPKVKKKK